MLLGVAMVIVGSGVLYFAVTNKDPRGLLTGQSAPGPFDLGPYIGLRAIKSPKDVGKAAGAAIDIITGAPRSGTAQIRVIVAAARAVPGWHLGRICGTDTLAGSSVSEHHYCNAADLMCSLAVGAVLSQFLINAGRAGVLPIHCVIWNRRSWSREGGWRSRPYSGASAHTDHVHVSGWPSKGGSC